MNEGDYLELCNDLKKQYDAMKEKYQKRIAFLEQTIRELKEIKGIDVQFQYNVNNFTSPRPQASEPEYSSAPEPLNPQWFRNGEHF